MTVEVEPLPTGGSLVAICTPVYNGAKHLVETMEAVQKQTYANLIHVISDNASTDATAQILERYANARVKVIVSRSPHLIPQMANWNRSVSLAPPSAKWIRLLCADDPIEPTAIEKMVALGEQHSDVVLIGCDRFRNGVVDDFFWPKGRTVFDGADASRRWFEYRGTIMGPHVLVRRDAAHKDGAVFDEGLVCADTDMCLRVLRHGSFGFVHEPLATTREHRGSVTTDKLDGLKIHFLEWLAYLDRYAPALYTREGFEALRGRYVRYYLRKLLIWRLAPNGRSVFDMHRERLAGFGIKTGPFNFIGSLFDWILKRLKLRQGWVGYPF